MSSQEEIKRLAEIKNNQTFISHSELLSIKEKIILTESLYNPSIGKNGFISSPLKLKLKNEIIPMQQVKQRKTSKDIKKTTNIE